ncbi:MAG: hypothetical protein QOG09_1368 [Solirubrobacterales bacterium]|jgi:hypothetical protein|nr:hypothetical protein [Solirubrobacterales bacterium]
MAVIESPETLGLKPFHEFDAANETWPRGDRPAAIREAAAEFRARFAIEENRVKAVRTVDIAEAGYPIAYAFGDAVRTANPASRVLAARAGILGPFVNILNRLIVVQYEDFDGDERTFVYEPTVTEGPAEAPFYEYLLSRYGEFLSYKVLAKIYSTVPQALAKAGVSAEQVDFISFDHLHVQDARFVLGTTEPFGDKPSLPPIFPNAKMVIQRKEWDTFASLHPMQWAWYVEDGIKGIPEENVVLVEGDVELGRGLALVATPGHTDGNHSLCINTPDGVWVSSENGVAADNWHPHLSKIPGVRRFAEVFGREVILNANTLEDSIDQYDSMVKEKALADPNRADPRFLNVFPSSELVDSKAQWPVVPTFHYGGINYGEMTRST